jgi:hypothetical protein|tara:strand:+ start:674 stop:895 length:222 start_codon:yes stop_codon:yes gene_type:complete
MAKKISFPMGNGEIKNGYFNGTSIPQAIQQNKNRKNVKKRQRLAKAGLNIPQQSTRASEPVQSASFKSGYRNS